MAETTNISWCDRTWSPWYGCTQISMGAKGACVACYARQLSEIRMGRVVFGGPGRGEGTRDARADGAWKEPMKWQRAVEAECGFWDGYGEKPTEFIFPSMCDPFDNHPDLPPLRKRFFGLMRATPHLTWLPLTKRPGNILRLFAETIPQIDPMELLGSDVPREMVLGENTRWPKNAAVGFTAVTQAEFDRDWPKAREAFHILGAPFVFWSGEPLMEGIILPPDFLALGGRAWAITGGETSQGAHRARPSSIQWFRAIRDQCAEAGVPFHHKQNGEWVDHFSPEAADYRARVPAPTTLGYRNDMATRTILIGKKNAGRALDGVIYDGRPALRAA